MSNNEINDANKNDHKSNEDIFLNIVIVFLSIAVLATGGFFYVHIANKPGVADGFRKMVQQIMPSKVERAHKRCVSILSRKSLSMSGGLGGVPREQRQAMEELVKAQMENTCRVMLIDCYDDPKGEKCAQAMAAEVWRKL